MDEAAEWAARSRSFGAVAEAYDRYRPGYPDALYADVLASAGGTRGPVRVLEAGAGTGRATLALAQRGAHVTAVEPDPEMAAVARRRTEGLPVTVIESAFESCAAASAAFDLVVSAQAWHWVDDTRGGPRAAAALRSGGALCAWWNRPARLGGPAWEAVHAAYAEHAPELGKRTILHAPFGAEQAGDPGPPPPGFTPWALRGYDWAASYTGAEYAGLIGTHSDHVLLPQAQQRALFEAVAAAIDGAGGRLDYPYKTILLTARPLA